MDKEVATTIYKFLDRVETRGHQERAVMDRCIQELVQHIQPAEATDVVEVTEEDAE